MTQFRSLNVPRCVFKIGGSETPSGLEDKIFNTIRSKLVMSEHHKNDLRQAAVSMIVKDKENPSVLLIKRAKKKGDPWSGQVAFPGGKMQDGEKTAKQTAIRETREEVGIDLGESSEFLGYAEPVTTHTGEMTVVPSVFVTKRQVKVRPNEEVASYRWVKVEDLLSSQATSSYRLKYGGRIVQLPAFSARGFVVWGLTYRILSSILGVPEKPWVQSSKGRAS
jgi:8-oxo-dGTP pyrophosphatase MutT (NUDIX family)